MNSVALTWLMSTSPSPLNRVVDATRVTDQDAAGVRATSAMFAGLDNRFGGRHSRLAAVQYLDDQVTPLLRGSYQESTGRNLFTAASELARCIGWMSYDNTEHDLARRYFLQALSFAKHAGDRELGASVLSALSHQANLVGDAPEARDLARAARHAARGSRSHTLQAQFAAMEARALASLGEREQCLRALGDAEAHFAKRDFIEDPPWISYFDSTELAAEAAHCRRDLGEYARAADVLGQCASWDEGYTRSNAFAGIVRVESLLGADQLEEAAEVGGDVLSTCMDLASARIDIYLERLRCRLAPVSDSTAVASFADALDLVMKHRATRWPGQPRPS